MKLNVDRTGWAWPILGILGSCGAIAGAYAFLFGQRDITTGGAIAFVFTAPIGLLGMAAWIHGYPYLIADVPAGKLHYVNSKTERHTVPLGQIELSIEEKTMKSRTVSHYFNVRSPQFGDRVLFTSFDRNLAEQRQALLIDLAAQSAIRPLLATAQTAGGDAFRTPPDLMPQLQNAVPDPQRLRAAMAGLGHDPDPAIATTARALTPTLPGAAP
jgi:hypothetical protein